MYMGIGIGNATEGIADGFLNCFKSADNTDIWDDDDVE